MHRSVLGVLLLVCSGWAAFTTPIKHVVVLMEENRSMDHFFGFSAIPGVEGLTGKEYNLLDLSDPKSKKIYVTSDSPYVGPCDPCHGQPCTTHKVYGKDSDKGTPDMSGFVDYQKKDTEYCGVMKMFGKPALPVMNALVEEFAVFNRFYCSVPGPTWPNRLFALSATSAGCTETGTYYENVPMKPFPQKTIFDSLAEQNLTWKNYYDDVPWETTILATLQRKDSKPNIQNMTQFLRDAADGTLPNFAWLNPRAAVDPATGEGSNDDHPDHDVRLGEKLKKQVYEALRAGKAWNETLFIITYDEHGGFYDHVAPPATCPAPANSTPSYPDTFDFKRLGVRIPTLLISPWIAKGTVIQRPSGPEPSSEYELSSIPGTVKEMFGLPDYLTSRDTWAGKFTGFLTQLSAPRTDCPTTLPDAPKGYTEASSQWESEQPLNGLQHDMLGWMSQLVGEQLPRMETLRQGDAGPLFAKMTKKFLERE